MEERDTASRLPDDEKTAIDIKFATFAWDALDKAGKGTGTAHCGVTMRGLRHRKSRSRSGSGPEDRVQIGP